LRYTPGMATVSIRELANHTKSVVEEVARSGRPALVTQRGKPVVAVVPIDEAALEDWVLANAAEFVHAMADDDELIAAGGHGTPLDDVLAELQSVESVSSRPSEQPKP
jgi:prevent-host-death family protein